jgi:hypothetical protein
MKQRHGYVQVVDMRRRKASKTVSIRKKKRKRREAKSRAAEHQLCCYAV